MRFLLLIATHASLRLGSILDSLGTIIGGIIVLEGYNIQATTAYVFIKCWSDLFEAASSKSSASVGND